VDALGSRIDMLSKELLAAAEAHAPDRNEAYFRAHVAFVRIWRNDPNLIGKLPPMNRFNS